MDTFVSVIIPVYNDCQRIKFCLEALGRQTYPQGLYEVIVVDNGNNSGIGKIVELFHRAKLINEPRLGSYAARNKGLAAAQGEIIAFTDSDCIPRDDWIAKGVEKLLQEPNCGLVGGKVEIFFRIPNSPNPVEYYDNMAYLNQERSICKYHGVLTANAFTFKKVFERIGLFDENRYSFSDGEWAQRIYLSGFTQVYASDVVVQHPARNSYRALYERIGRQVGAMYLFSPAQGKRLKAPFRPDVFIENLILQSQDNKFKQFKYRLFFFLVAAFVFICKIFESMRLLFGARPKR